MKIYEMEGETRQVTEEREAPLEIRPVEIEVFEVKAAEITVLEQATVPE